jgi:hypothetical protein
VVSFTLSSTKKPPTCSLNTHLGGNGVGVGVGVRSWGWELGVGVGVGLGLLHFVFLVPEAAYLARTHLGEVGLGI